MDIEIIKKNISSVLTETNFPWLGEKKVGKVRDTYFSNNKIVLITYVNKKSMTEIRCTRAIRFESMR